MRNFHKTETNKISPASINLNQYEAIAMQNKSCTVEIQSILNGSDTKPLFSRLRTQLSKISYNLQEPTFHFPDPSIHSEVLLKQGSILSDRQEGNIDCDLSYHLIREINNFASYKANSFTVQIERTLGDIAFIEKKWIYPNKSIRIDQLKKHLKNLEELRTRYEPILLEVERLLSINQPVMSRLTELHEKLAHTTAWLNAADKKLKKLAREERARFRADIEAVKKAKIARMDDKSRFLAATLKKEIKPGALCPYCGRPIGDDPHLDHIYPLRMGGLSVKENLLYVCRECNLSKSDMGIIQFVSSRSYDLAIIAARLRKLGKTV